MSVSGVRLQAFLLAAIVVAAAIAGCGGGSTGDSGGTDPAADSRPNSSGGSKGNTAASDGDSTESVVRTVDGRKWLGDPNTTGVPLDVWHDDPLAVYQNSQQTIAAATPTPAGGTAAETPATNAPPAAGTAAETTADAGTAAGGEWEAVVSAPVIEAESKKIRNDLTAQMQTVGTYNGNVKTIQMEGSVLAALGGIAAAHPGDIPWKDKAPIVRDLGTKIEEGAQELGRKGYDATQPPYEQFIVVMNGSEPAGLEPPEPNAPFAEKASRSGLMQRMKLAHDWLTKNINTEERFKDAANKEQIVHEAQILGALAQVIATPEYDSATEAEYQNEALGMVQDSRDAVQAHSDGGFEKFQGALDRMTNRCNNCHQGFRFSE